MKIALVSCVKTKRTEATRARDLYISPLFRGLRRYAETHADRWYILSAKHGLLDPLTIVEPYEQTLNRLSKEQRIAWADSVKADLTLRTPSDADFIVLAGKSYREDIESFLRERGKVEVPLKGLSFGRQLTWLKHHGMLTP
ncbi:MAG: DUF6884 domain-containing protein [bacterium]